MNINDDILAVIVKSQGVHNAKLKWADIDTLNGDQTPSGFVGLGDIMGAIKLFQQQDVAPLIWFDIPPSTGNQVPDQNIGLADTVSAIAGFQGQQYPGERPLSCP